MHFGTEGQFRAFLTKNGAPPDRQSLICVDYLSDYNWERLDCVKDRIKESKTHNKQHTHSLSDGIQAGSSPRSFRVVALGTVRRFRLYNKPQRRVWWKPGALSAGFPAADTLENTSVSGFLLASFFGTPGVGRPCCAQGGMLTLSGQGGRREEGVNEATRPLVFQWEEGALLRLIAGLRTDLFHRFIVALVLVILRVVRFLKSPFQVK